MKFKFIIKFIRLRKMREKKEQMARLKLQAIYRGHLGRKKFKRLNRQLMRLRALNLRAKQTAAAIKVQCRIRQYLAKKLVRSRLGIIKEMIKEQETLRQVEDELELMHGEWMKDILVIRAQTVVRLILSKKYQFVIINKY